MEVAPDKGAVRLTSPPVAVGLARRRATRHARAMCGMSVNATEAMVI